MEITVKFESWEELQRFCVSQPLHRVVVPPLSRRMERKRDGRGKWWSRMTDEQRHEVILKRRMTRLKNKDILGGLHEVR